MTEIPFFESPVGEDNSILGDFGIFPEINGRSRTASKDEFSKDRSQCLKRRINNPSEARCNSLVAFARSAADSPG